MDCTQFRATIEALRAGPIRAAVPEPFWDHARSCPACAERHAPYLARRCSEVTEFLADYLEGTLEPTERDVFDFHLNVCPECRRYLESYAATIRVARACAADEPAPPRALVEAILAARRAPPR